MPAASSSHIKTPPKPLLIVGASARAAAASARLAGFDPWCVDLFTDRDLQAMAHARRCPPDRYPNGLIRKLWRLPGDAPVLLTGAMDQHLGVVAAIARFWRLRGCQVHHIAAVRDPHVWNDASPCAGVAFPRIFTQLPETLVAGKYLWKPCDTDRRPGDHVQEWSQALSLPRGYLQQYIEGQDLGVVYYAVGARAVMLGVTQQIIAEPRLKARQAQYAGSVGPLPIDEQTRSALLHLGNYLASQGLVQGLFGIDLRRDASGCVWPIEINPRYTASVEVIERVMKIPCLRSPGELISNEGPNVHRPLYRPNQMLAKGIVYSDRDMPAPPVTDWFDRDEVADVPQPWRRIYAGGPVCTLFARGKTVDDCKARLYAMADRIYARLDAWPA